MNKSSGKNLYWDLLSSRGDRDYNLFSVEINTCRSPRTGLTHDFQILKSPDWVAVVALTEKKEVILVNQFRHGTRELSLELPGGLVKEGQSPIKSASEELMEETGFVAPSLKLVGWTHPLPALFNNKFYVYMAENAVYTGELNPDETEELETVLAPLKELKNFIREGKINCGIMIAAISMFNLFVETT
ncbi:MAG: NUDIX hydrolase [Deltaproteobacteria bacterium]|nr:NUDIX hydrolase [Deltaproteobacteria bacterium]